MLIFWVSFLELPLLIGGSRGGAPGARPPYGSRFFRFDMQNFRNIAALGVHGPPYEVHAPPKGNPGSATVTCTFLPSAVWTLIADSTVDSPIIIQSAKKLHLRYCFLQVKPQMTLQCYPVCVLQETCSPILYHTKMCLDVQIL